MRGGFWKGITELSYVIILLGRTLLKCKVENWKLIAVKRDSWIANRCPSLNAVLSTDVKCVQLEKKKINFKIQILTSFKVTFIPKSFTCRER